MKVSDLLVEVRDASYNRIGVITGNYLVGFNCVLRYNAIGTWTLSLPANHRLQSAITTPGAGIVVTLLGNTLFSGPVTWFQTIQTMNDAVGVTQITGLDDSVLLRDRLAYPTPSTADVTLQTSAYDARTGLAETVMKAYVNANMGASAPVARQAARFSTQLDYGRGTTVTYSARFDILYELLQALANASLQGGTALGFDVLQVGTGVQFQVFAPTDRSATVRLDIANNLVTETTYSVAAPKTTRAIVGGQGDAAARAFIERTSTASLAAETSWARRIESFVDSRGSTTTAALQTDGDNLLGTDGKAQITASIKPTDNTAMLFGRDWFLGDTVSVVVGSYTLAAIVSELALSVDVDGVRLYGTVGEPKLQTYEQQILNQQANLSGRLNNLERYK